MIWPGIPVLFIYETLFPPAGPHCHKSLTRPKCCISCQANNHLEVFHTHPAALWDEMFILLATNQPIAWQQPGGIRDVRRWRGQTKRTSEWTGKERGPGGDFERGEHSCWSQTCWFVCLANCCWSTTSQNISTIISSLTIVLVVTDVFKNYNYHYYYYFSYLYFILFFSLSHLRQKKKNKGLNLHYFGRCILL